MLIHYYVEYWSEDSNRLEKEEGITFGYSLGDGTGRIAEFYGEKNIFSVEVYQLEDVLMGSELNSMGPWTSTVE